MSINSNSSKQPAKQPIFRKKLPGGISTAVFENVRDGRTYRSVNLQRSYRNKNGEWSRMSMYLDHEHIPFMIELLQGTWDFLNNQAYAGNFEHEESVEEVVEPTIEQDA